MNRVDHIVIGCASLASGEAWMTEQLGVGPVAHGVHDTVGTHNALWGLGSAYLEVIAIDPNGITPDFPRWFGLDEPVIQAELANGPQLLTWVWEVDDIDAAAPHAEADEVRHLSRGALSWRLGRPRDGRLRSNGALPSVIQWDEGMAHPRTTLDPQGWSLEWVSVRGDATLSAQLNALDAAKDVSIEHGAPGLEVRFSHSEGRSCTLRRG